MKKVLNSLNISKTLAATFVIGLLAVPSISMAFMVPYASSCQLVDCDFLGGVVTIEATDDCECIGESINFGSCQLRLKDGASCFIADSDITGDHFTILGQTGVPKVDVDSTEVTVDKFVLKNIDALVNDSVVNSSQGISSAGNRTGHRVRIFNTEINDN